VKDFSSTVHSLRSLRRSDPPRALALAYAAIAHAPEDPDVRDTVSWIFLDNLYEPFQLPDDERDLPDRVALLHRMASWTPEGPYSSSNAAVPCVLSLAFNLNRAKRPGDALEMLDLLRVADITDKPSRKFPSLRSRWYVIRTRALNDLERWSELESCCIDALNNSTIGRNSVASVRNRLERARRKLNLD